MPTIEEDLASFQDSLEHIATVVMFAYCGNLKNKSLRGQDWRQLNLNEDLVFRIKTDLRDELIRITNENQIHSYTYDDVLDHEFNYLPKTEAEAFLTKLDQAPVPANVRTFDANTDAPNASAFMYRVQFNHPDADIEDLLLYQKVSEGKILKQSTGMIQVFQDNENEIKVSDQNVFYIEPSVDFGLWEDHLFIFAHRGFESISGYLEATVQKAEELLDVLADADDVEINGFDEFRLELGSRVRDVRKIAAAQSRDFGTHLTKENMLAVLGDFDLRVPYREEDGILKIDVPDDKDQKRDLIDLLSGKHVYSAAGNERLLGNSLKKFNR